MSLTQYLGRLPLLIEASIENQRGLFDPVAESLQTWLRELVERGGAPARTIKDALHGIWLGHPLHPALTDLTIGAWSTGMLLDLGGQSQAADRVIAIGVISALPTALAGVTDWAETEEKQRRNGLVHAALNTVSLALYIWSLVARRKRQRRFGVALSTTGFALSLSSAYLGGELVYGQGTGVSRNAWSPDIEKFQVAAKASDLADGKPARGEVTLDGQKVPVLLVRSGDRIRALHDVCTHWGESLAKGKLVMGGEAIECPWHHSTFRLDDGTVVHGPATIPQPCFEARSRAGHIEVRRARPT